MKRRHSQSLDDSAGDARKSIKAERVDEISLVSDDDKESKTPVPITAPVKSVESAATDTDVRDLAFFTNAITNLDNAHSVHLTDLFAGPITRALLMNYCWDWQWLCAEIPELLTIPRVDLVSGQRDNGLRVSVRTSGATNVHVHLAPLPILYGCHHTKMILLFYQHGLRVVVLTANFLECDVKFKNQAIFVQDFPIINDSLRVVRTEAGDDFERTLCEYFTRYKQCGVDVVDDIRRYDFSAAKSVLVPSMPGSYTSQSMSRVGHMKVRHWLNKSCVLDDALSSTPIVAQFSSLGSTTGKWLDELTASFANHNKAIIGQSQAISVKLVWPRTVDVQWSMEGWAAGGSLCCESKNIKPHIRDRYHLWDGRALGRHSAMPHIKSYSRSLAGRLGWCLIGSANLSAAAWGALQKNNTQFAIRHYEMAALFLPSIFENLIKSRHPNYDFTCTPNNPYYTRQRTNFLPSTVAKNSHSVLSVRFETQNHSDRNTSNESYHRLICPLPYSLNPPRYTADDQPWNWTDAQNEPDVHGNKWRGHGVGSDDKD